MPDAGVLVVGDAMLDVVAVSETVAEISVAALDYADAAIGMRAGGTGVNLALEAARTGCTPVHLVCSLGHDTADRSADLAARTVLGELERAGIAVTVNPAAGRPTGTAVIGYVADGSRIMFGASGANEEPWTDGTAARARGALGSVRALLVSGWMLFRPSTRDDVRRLVRDAARLGVPVVLDVVPHAVHKAVSPEEFARLTADVDYVSGSMHTLAGLLPRRPAHDHPKPVVEALLESFAGALTYDDTGAFHLADRSGLSRSGDIPRPDRTASLRGATDRFLVSALGDWVPGL